MADYLVQEDGSSKILLVDAEPGAIILDATPPTPSGEGTVFHSPLRNMGGMMQ